MMRTRSDVPPVASTLHLRIREINVDAALLGEMPRERLAEQLQAAFARGLSGRTTHTPSTLAQHIADAATPQMLAPLAERAETALVRRARQAARSAAHVAEDWSGA